jgi:hypothetical protein
MAVNGNQGSRPNYHSTLETIKTSAIPYTEETHQQWLVSCFSPVYMIIWKLEHIIIGRRCSFAVTSHRS